MNAPPRQIKMLPITFAPADSPGPTLEEAELSLLREQLAKRPPQKPHYRLHVTVTFRGNRRWWIENLTTGNATRDCKLVSSLFRLAVLI